MKAIPIRTTLSVCPVCMDVLDAAVVEKAGGVYLEKECRRHGVFSVRICDRPAAYRELSDFYFYFVPQALPQREYYLNATTRCSLNCPICYLRYCDTIEELPLDRVREAARIKKIKRFTFSHGEATDCGRLFEMIRILKQAGKIVNLHTNALKIADVRYAGELKASGIDHVSVQFDGFNEDVCRSVRGGDFLKTKLEALENLNRMSVPVTLNATISKGVNEPEIGKIFDYALSAPYIKDLSFITYSYYEPARTNSDKYIMPHELIKHLEAHTDGKISEEAVIAFQKLFYAYMSVTEKRKCFYYFHFMVVRCGRGYRPINEFIDLKKVSRDLSGLKAEKKKLSYARFIWFLILSLTPRAIMLIPAGLGTFLRGGYPRKPGKFLSITFASICDPYKFDARIAENCGQGIITGTRVHDSYGAYLMEQMKKADNRRENCVC
ncbi:MAG: radical SAM protein [Candidatus Omnitrophica bacterium]|nr:radical SAM protein [Candidatus Omnitrophota bacterium]